MQSIRNLILVLALSGAQSASAETVTPAGPPADVAALACLDLTAPIDRLACYDTAFARPILPGDLSYKPAPGRTDPLEGEDALEQALAFVNAPVREGKTVGVTLIDRVNGATMSEAEAAALVSGSADIEALREGADLILALQSDATIGEAAVLTISCRSRITELRVIWDQPFEGRRIEARFLADGLAPETINMRLRDGGHVLDGPRGLAAIEAIRRFLSAALLQVGVQEPDGAPRSAFFERADLKTAIRMQAQLCSWTK